MTLRTLLQDRLGLDRVLLGAATRAIVVLSVECALVAWVSWAHDGALTRSPDNVMNLLPAALWILGACLAVHSLACLALRRFGVGARRSRVTALVLAPIGIPLAMLGLLPWGHYDPPEFLLFLFCAITFSGCVVMILPVIAAVTWTFLRMSPNPMPGDCT